MRTICMAPWWGIDGMTESFLNAQPAATFTHFDRLGELARWAGGRVLRAAPTQVAMLLSAYTARA